MNQVFIKRTIQKQIEKRLFLGRAIIIYGPRQVGKTTLVQAIAQKYQGEIFNCDEPDIREKLTNKTSTELKSFLGQRRLIVFDEAQRVPNIGLTIKLIVDNFPEKQIIATGSSSFELSNQINEPLTGRKYQFSLYPFSFSELTQIYSQRELNRLLEERLVFGQYPEIVLYPENREQKLKEISQSYLYKDVLEFERIKNPFLLQKLLQALALQIGQEVSANELASLLGINRLTVIRYLDILEKAFVIFPLNSFSRNLRNELKKRQKIYFYDLGIRNALINNFNPLSLRNDLGQLWENFLISERLKVNQARERQTNYYFWRTHQQQEIDFIEENEGKLIAFEFKWRAKKSHTPKAFLETYGTKVSQINQENYWEFIIKKKN